MSAIAAPERELEVEEVVEKPSTIIHGEITAERKPSPHHSHDFDWYSLLVALCFSGILVVVFVGFLYTELPVESRVEKGIIFLDQTYGPQWREKINWDFFNMRSGKYCILGQLEGSFFVGLAKHNFGLGSAVEHGFMGSLPEYVTGLMRIWKEKARL